jgi:hypothetical protein
MELKRQMLQSKNLRNTVADLLSIKSRQSALTKSPIGSYDPANISSSCEESTLPFYDRVRKEQGVAGQFQHQLKTYSNASLSLRGPKTRVAVNEPLPHPFLSDFTMGSADVRSSFDNRPSFPMKIIT